MKLNPSLVTYLRLCEEQVALGEELVPYPVRESVYVAEKRKLVDRLSEVQVDALVAEFLEGMSKAELGRRYGISPKSVQRVLRRRGVWREPG